MSYAGEYEWAQVWPHGICTEGHMSPSVRALPIGAVSWPMVYRLQGAPGGDQKSGVFASGIGYFAVLPPTSGLQHM